MNSNYYGIESELIEAMNTELEDLAGIFNLDQDYDITTATTLVQNYPELSLQDIRDFNRGYVHSWNI